MKNANDEKVMATSSGNQPGRIVKPVLETMNGSEASPIDAYYSFPASNVKAEETYSKRMSKLSDALGCKDEVKG